MLQIYAAVIFIIEQLYVCIFRQNLSYVYEVDIALNCIYGDLTKAKCDIGRF